ncbi:hypothetical protein [Mycoplasmopsis fermentans]|uniref:Uncharacterized protein n=2 Tax=Mycoplasmopsis fermentans TaxID=2115 RepID=C4XFK2_MYCFP|nr:hypothetical protein [Mycoplasmopsis fermentans]ADV34036.1 Hypothetical Protein MfeM64YM_0025 [Mycoplasmopsis fermentans M64]BAH69924.1 hypothetical protein MBIO_0659 [Mycoplasmopsis fermentans PG18]
MLDIIKRKRKTIKPAKDTYLENKQQIEKWTNKLVKYSIVKDSYPKYETEIVSI